MRSIILAAGRGTRLNPLTLNKPKPLVEILDKSLISRQVNILKSQGINDINVVAGYLGKQLINNEYNVIFNNEFENTNMVYSLFCAENLLEEDLIVSYGDIAYSPEILESLVKSKSDISIVVDLRWLDYWSKRFDNPLDDLESLILNANDEIINIGEKVNSYEQIQGQFIGLMKFSTLGVKRLKDTYSYLRSNGKIMNKDIRDAYMTDLLQEMINRGHKLKAIKIKAPWLEIDTIFDFNNVETKKRMKVIDRKINNFISDKKIY